MATKKPTAKKAAPKKVSAITPQYTDLKRLVENMEEDVAKFDNGTQAAGTRIRKGAQEIKKLCQSMRGAVTDIKNARK